MISVCHTCHQGAWEGHPSHFSIIRVVSERTNFMIFAIFRVPMVLWVVGKCTNLRDFSWRSFWYVILATRGLWKASGVKNLPRPSSNGEKSPIFWRSFSISRSSRPRTWAYGASPKSLVHKLQLRLLFGSSCYTKNFLREQNVKNV